MIDAAAAIRDRLLSISAVTTLVGARVTTGIRHQSGLLPAVIVNRAGDVKEGHLRGGNSLVQTRIHVDLRSAQRAEIIALDAAVQGDGAGATATGLNFWAGTVGSPSVALRLVKPIGSMNDTYLPDEKREYRVVRIFHVMHQQ